MENICSSGQIPYRSPIPAGSGEEVVVRARAYTLDLTGVKFWYTTNPAPTAQADWDSVAASYEDDCGTTYAMWKATLPALTSMLRYQVEYVDGAKSVWQRTPGEGSDGGLSDSPDWTTSSLFVYPLQAGVIKADQMQNWYFMDDGFPGALKQFAVGPTTPPLGSGSVKFAISGEQRMAVATAGFAGVRLADLTRLSYSSYVEEAGINAAVDISLSFDIDGDGTDNNAAYQGRLTYEPYMTHGNPIRDQWNTWNPLAGKWWGSRAPISDKCPQSAPCDLPTVLIHFPNAVISGNLLVKAGGPAHGLVAYADALSVEMTGGRSYTFDFEPIPGLFVDDDYTSAMPGYGSTYFSTIQSAIDAASAGAVINIFPGAYDETASGRRLYNGQGPYQFGLFIGQDKAGITLQGVDADGNPITDNAQVATSVKTNATNTFGYAGVWVEADGVTVSGLEILDNTPLNVKAFEVVGDDFSFLNNVVSVSDGGTIYIDDWRYVADPPASHIKSYTISGNAFTHGATLSIGNGAGVSGAVADRVITNNTFTADGVGAYWTAINFSGDVEGVGWLNYPVGGAVVSGNSFVDRGVPIRTRGIVLTDQFDWAAYLTDNTFDKKVVTWDPVADAPREFTYTSAPYTYNNVVQIGSTIQGEIDHAQPGDEVRVYGGLYPEAVTVNVEGLKLVAMEGPEATIIQGAMLQVMAKNVTVEGFTIDGDDGAGNLATSAVAVAGYDGVIIKDNVLINATKGVMGDYYGRPTNLTITGNTFGPGIAYGFAQTEGVTPIVISGNTFLTSVEGIGLGEGVGIGATIADVEALLAANTFKISGGYVIKDYRTAIVYVISPFSIQAAIDAAASGDTVYVGEGTYVENLVVNKPLTLWGKNRDTVLLYPAVSGPICEGGSLCTGASNMILVEANDVTIHGFTLDGDNPDLDNGVAEDNVNGADLDARNGIISNTAKSVTNLEVFDTVVRNIYLRGIYMANTGQFNFHDNVVTNVMASPSSIAMFAYGAGGEFKNNTVSLANDAISANHSKGIVFQNNVITQSGSGIHTDNSLPGVGKFDLIVGNTVSDCQPNAYGIWTFAHYQAPVVRENTISGCAIGLSAWGSSLVAPATTPAPVVFERNLVTGDGSVESVGLYVTTDLVGYGTAPTTVEARGNVISGFDVAVQVTADQMSWNSGPFVEHLAILTLFNNSLAGESLFSLGEVNTVSVNASGNWLGTIDSAQLGAVIDPRVDYTPYLHTGADTNANLMGFQGDFSILHVEDGGAQIGTVGRIREGIDLLKNGVQLYLEPGLYPENVEVRKLVHLLGAGNGDDPAVDSIVTTQNTNANMAVFQLIVSGQSPENPLLLDNLRIKPVNQLAIAVGNFASTDALILNNIALNQVHIAGTGMVMKPEQEIGFYVSQRSSVAGLVVNESVFEGLAFGMLVEKLSSEPNASSFTDIQMTNTIFRDNTMKGMYFEKLANAVFTDCQFIHNGSVAAVIPEYLQKVGSGIDINLKNGTYSDITFLRPVILDNGIGAQNGVGIAIKARSDAPSYGQYPGQLTNVQVTGGLISGNEHGVIIGEPDKVNAGPADVVFRANRIFGNFQTEAGAGVTSGIINYSSFPLDARRNWFGCNEGPEVEGAGCDAIFPLPTAVSPQASYNGPVTVNPWLVLTTTVDPAKVTLGQGGVVVTGSLNLDSDGGLLPMDLFIPDGTPMSFTAEGGSLDVAQTVTVGGMGYSNFSQGQLPGLFQICAEVDNETNCTQLMIEDIPPVIGPTGVKIYLPITTK